MLGSTGCQSGNQQDACPRGRVRARRGRGGVEQSVSRAHANVVLIIVLWWMLDLRIRCTRSIPPRRVGCEGALPIVVAIARLSCVTFHGATGDKAPAEHLRPRREYQ